MNVVINGRGLGGHINGIPRYMYELIAALDSELDDNLDVEIVVPNGTDTKLVLKNIDITYLPQNFLWDYFQAERYARKKEALYINLANKGCIYRNSICTFHDIRILTFGDGKKTLKSLKTKVKFFISYYLGIKNAKNVVTVSNTEKMEICKFSNVNSERVIVASPGYDHILKTGVDDEIFINNPNIIKGEYYIAISSIAPHKNFEWIINNANLYPENQYVIIGGADPNLWADTTKSFNISNVIYLGYQSDECIKSLISNAKALVHPTKYEGFGIPPLEALACGTPIIISNIPVLKEIYSGCGNFINPEDDSIDLNLLEPINSSSVDEILSKYTWKNCALIWLNQIKKLEMN